ncbi:hypothetical protein [Pasteuria penetrans]|uniref:hypothetical protein n=1 Tax=Pasteuria penetrans TaxID=86005 RepID=UPI0011F018E7|nr:hypothetical protein [Pasteuria penetrans]
MMDSAHQLLGMAGNIWGKKGAGGNLFPKLPLKPKGNDPPFSHEPNFESQQNPGHPGGLLSPNLDLDPPSGPSGMGNQGMGNHQGMGRNPGTQQSARNGYPPGDNSDNNEGGSLPDPKTIMGMLQSPIVQKWISQWLSKGKR